MEDKAGEISTEESTKRKAPWEYPLSGWYRHADVEHFIDFSELKRVEVAQAVPEEEGPETVGEHST